MRITASILDEDPYEFDIVSSEIDTKGRGEKPKKADFNWFFKNFAAKQGKRRKDSTLKENAEHCIKTQKDLHQHQKLNEMTQKFKNLHLSDLSSFCQNCNSVFEMASTSKAMENTSGIQGEDIDLEPPPTWLQQYLLQMKHEIKKEVLDELLQASQGELPTIKPGAVTKVEENQSDFQGEVIHTGIFCDNCDQLIHGIRYKCGNCSDFDLCQECESLPNIHNKNHIFLKIRYPIALKMYLRQRCEEIMTCPNPGKVYMGSRSRQAKKLYEARFMCDETIPDSTILPPSTKFVKSWRVVNSGSRVWTHATKLRLIQGSAALAPSNDHVDVPHLKPGEEGVISVLFTTPSYPGVYRSHWNFCHKSRPFGDIVWCHIVVKSPEEVQNESEKPSLQTEKEVPGKVRTLNSKSMNKRREVMPKCHEIIKELFSEKNKAFASPFYSVDLKVKTPMDLNIVKSKLEDNVYQIPEEFASDVRLIITNCYKYNPDPACVDLAIELLNAFAAMYAKIYDGPSATEVAPVPSTTEVAPVPSTTEVAPVPSTTAEVRTRSSSESSSSDSDEEKKREFLKHLQDEVDKNNQKEVSCIAQVLTAVKKEHDRGNMVPRKLVVSSHTATPNNTPFDLTPPKSPDHHATTIKEVHNIAAENSSQHLKDSENEDDECSVLSLGSSESDTEFVVIPMPKCFNLSESFVSQHIPHWFQDMPTETATEHSGKTVHKMMQLGKQEIGVITSENSAPQNCETKRTPLTSETVSQETGVPELSVISCDQTLLEIVEKQNDAVKTNSVSLVTDGSSSEVSIIESGGNSPTVENATQTIGSINISLSSEVIGNASEVDKIEICVDNNAESENIVQEVQTELEDQAADISCNATFPKFPVDLVNSTYDPSPASNEERTVQVLPEGLVTGALSAAASVYNTARAVISTMQQPRNATGAMLQELPSSARNEPGLNARRIVLNPMEQLIEMGFCNRQQNEDLLRKHNGDVPLVVAELVNLNDNDWYASRHIPSPPPFD